MDPLNLSEEVQKDWALRKTLNAPILAMAVSPDKKLLVDAGWDGVLFVTAKGSVTTEAPSPELPPTKIQNGGWFLEKSKSIES